MGEAFITRRGERVKSGTVTATDTSLTIPELIGAKNAIVTIADALSNSYSYVGVVHIDNGIVSRVLFANKGSYALWDYTDMLIFDATTGKLSIPNGNNLYFFYTSAPYRYVVY